MRRSADAAQGSLPGKYPDNAFHGISNGHYLRSHFIGDGDPKFVLEFHHQFYTVESHWIHRAFTFAVYSCYQII